MDSYKRLLWDGLWDCGVEQYAPDLIEAALTVLQSADLLHGVTLDLGCGPSPVSKVLDRKTCRVIEVDVSAKGESGLANTLRLAFDLEALYSNREATRAALKSVASFLGMSRQP